jgi:hypothetical protein
MSKEKVRSEVSVGLVETGSSMPAKILDSLRNTVRNNKLIMVLALAVGIGPGCDGACVSGVHSSFNCNPDCNSKKEKEATSYKELKKDRTPTEIESDQSNL